MIKQILHFYFSFKCNCKATPIPPKKKVDSLFAGNNCARKNSSASQDPKVEKVFERNHFLYKRDLWNIWSDHSDLKIKKDSLCNSSQISSGLYFVSFVNLQYIHEMYDMPFKKSMIDNWWKYIFQTWLASKLAWSAWLSCSWWGAIRSR